MARKVHVVGILASPRIPAPLCGVRFAALKERMQQQWASPVNEPNAANHG
jgi:hypothetical protein